LIAEPHAVAAGHRGALLDQQRPQHSPYRAVPGAVLAVIDPADQAVHGGHHARAPKRLVHRGGVVVVDDDRALAGEVALGADRLAEPGVGQTVLVVVIEPRPVVGAPLRLAVGAQRDAFLAAGAGSSCHAEHCSRGRGGALAFRIGIVL
jgi:hypothetical protein